MGVKASFPVLEAKPRRVAGGVCVSETPVGWCWWSPPSPGGSGEPSCQSLALLIAARGAAWPENLPGGAGRKA